MTCENLHSNHDFVIWKKSCSIDPSWPETVIPIYALTVCSDLGTQSLPGWNDCIPVDPFRLRLMWLLQDLSRSFVLWVGGGYWFSRPVRFCHWRQFCAILVLQVLGSFVELELKYGVGDTSGVGAAAVVVPVETVVKLQSFHCDIPVAECDGDDVVGSDTNAHIALVVAAADMVPAAVAAAVGLQLAMVGCDDDDWPFLLQSWSAKPDDLRQLENMDQAQPVDWRMTRWSSRHHSFVAERRFVPCHELNQKYCHLFWVMVPMIQIWLQVG
mmetsp:Transcript_14581/g.41331  ORF Transcript_14581/g.41331 Transcript_14581/m.41331 type:complete len:270 (-) Transcript_14581:34-843(-)